MCNVLEIHYSSVVKVLTWEDNVVKITRMGVGDWVLIGIPPSVAKVEATHKSNAAVDETKFLMMCPVQYDILVYTIDGFESILGKVCHGLCI